MKLLKGIFSCVLSAAIGCVCFATVGCGETENGNGSTSDERESADVADSNAQESAGGAEPSPHVCEFESVWSGDGEEHWKACKSETCEKTSAKAAHDWESGALNDGVMNYACSVCAKTRTENKTALYRSVCGSISEAMLHLGEGGKSTLGKKLAAQEDETFTEASDYVNVKSAGAFVSFLADMMANDSFKITDKPVAFSYSYRGAFREDGTAVLMYRFLERENKVTMYWKVNSVTYGNPASFFLYLDVDYDFAENLVNAFTVYRNGDGGLICNVYESGKLCELRQGADTSEILARANAKESELTASRENTVDLNADFSEEYTKMMDFMNS